MNYVYFMPIIFSTWNQTRLRGREQKGYCPPRFFPLPTQNFWTSILREFLPLKGVDALHIANHNREECKKNYPEVITELRSLFENPNTESAEQIFVWLGKYKNILNSMTKRKHMFFLHCLVVERNLYTEWCYENGLKPKLPSEKR